MRWECGWIFHLWTRLLQSHYLCIPPRAYFPETLIIIFVFGEICRQYFVVESDWWVEGKAVESEGSLLECYLVLLNHFHFMVLAIVDTRPYTSSSVFNRIYCLWRSCRSICKINIQYCRVRALCLCILTAQSLLWGQSRGSGGQYHRNADLWQAFIDHFLILNRADVHVSARW